VGKSTIYWHWPDNLTLMADAFERFHQQMVPDLPGLFRPKRCRATCPSRRGVVVDSTFSR